MDQMANAYKIVNYKRLRIKKKAHAEHHTSFDNARS